MTLETWASLVVVVGAMATGYVAMRRDLRRELSREIGGLRTDVETGFARADERHDAMSARVDEKFDARDEKLDAMLAEMRAGFARQAEGIARLDDRVYALAAGLRPLVEQAEKSA